MEINPHPVRRAAIGNILIRPGSVKALDRIMPVHVSKEIPGRCRIRHSCELVNRCNDHARALRVHLIVDGVRRYWSHAA